MLRTWLKNISIKEVSSYLRDMSLRYKLIATYLTSILIPLMVLGGILYGISIKELETEMRKVSLQSVRQTVKTLDEYINQIDTISLMPYTDKNLEEYLINNSGLDTSLSKYVISTSGIRVEKESDGKADIANLEAFLLSLMGVRQDIDFVSIITLDNKIITKSRYGIVKPQFDFLKEPLYKGLRESAGELTVIPIHTSDYVFAPSQKIFSIGRKIFNFQVGAYTGYVLLDCSDKAFKKICSDVNIGKTGYVFVTDTNGNVFYSSKNLDSIEKYRAVIDKSKNSKNINSLEKLNNEKLILVGATSDYSGFTVTGIVPYSDVSQRVNGIKTVFVVLCLSCMFLVFVSSIFISNSLTNPIRTLQKAMKVVEKGNTDVQVPINSNDEVGRLSQSFNRLIQKISLLLSSIKSIEIKKKEAELNALKSQINPHFLYNTLNSIRMMAIIDDKMNIADATEALANLFRYSTKQKDDILNVSEELKHIENYICLLKIRYEDKFDVAYDIDDSIMKYKTVKFTLQPIIENAIYHGLEKKTGNGLLTISCQKNGDKLVFKIADNGTGIEEEKLQKIRDNIIKHEEEKDESIGLKNVHQRIVQYFGEEYGLNINSKAGEGTCVELVIPAFEDEKWVMESVSSISGR